MTQETKEHAEMLIEGFGKALQAMAKTYVTKDDLNEAMREQDKKMIALEGRLDEKMMALEERLDEKMMALEERLDEKMIALEGRLNKAMTHQTDRVLEVLNRYEKITERHERIINVVKDELNKE